MRLAFGVNFNQKIEKLPPHLKILHFEGFFNHKITLPSSLTHLHLSMYFDQYIDFTQVPHLKYLKIGQHYNKSFLFPQSLISLALHKQQVKTWPPNLKHLYLTPEYPHQILIDDLPKSLETIRMGFQKINVDTYRKISL